MLRYQSKTMWFALLFVCWLPMAVNATEITVVTEDWRPYNYPEGNEVKGTSTEVVKKMFEKAQIPYKIHVYPWARSYAMAQEKPNVLIYTIIRIDPREKLFKWVRPLGKGGTTSLYKLKKNQQINPQTVDEAKKYKIAANKDSMDHVWLEYSGFKTLETPPKVENAVKMLFMGDRVDLLAFDDAVIKEEFPKFGFNYEDVVQVMPLFKTPPYMAMSLSTSDEIVQKLQVAYDELLKENKIQLVN